eukprot:2135504-Prymnesium_polylepis.1
MDGGCDTVERRSDPSKWEVGKPLATARVLDAAAPLHRRHRRVACASSSAAAMCQTVGVLSVRLIDVIPMLTCVRTGVYGRTVPSAEGTLESSPAA